MMLRHAIAAANEREQQKAWTHNVNVCVVYKSICSKKVNRFIQSLGDLGSQYWTGADWLCCCSRQWNQSDCPVQSVTLPKPAGFEFMHNAPHSRQGQVNESSGPIALRCCLRLKAVNCCRVMSSSSSKKLQLHLEVLVKQEYLFVQIVLIDSHHYWHAQRTLKISRLGCHPNKNPVLFCAAFIATEHTSKLV